MLEVKGINIGQGMPFEGLKQISELLSFEGEPMLIHHSDHKDSDWISYWVDFDKNGKRWMFGKLRKEELYYYLIGTKTLRQLFKEISSDYVFLIDYDINDEVISSLMLNSYSIPDKYFAGENSYYESGINEFYQKYLNDNYYIDRLRHESYRVIAEPADGQHGRTVSAKDAAMVLFGTAKSMEGFVDVTGFNMLKQKPIDRTKINKRINRFKEQLSPRIAQNVFHSFEVWLTMDVISMVSEDKDEVKWRNEIIEKYKNDVLNVDISSAEDARIIEEKYTLEERKKIFDPLIRIYDNENISVTISDYKNTFRREFKNKPLSNEFKEIVSPKPTKEDEEKEKNVQDTLVALIVRMKDGEDIGRIKIKDLRANLLFSETQPDIAYTINSPVEYKGVKYNLKKPIKCHFVIKADNVQELYNTELELSSEGKDYDEVVNSFMGSLGSLIEQYIKGKENDRREPIYVEIEKYFEI